MALGGYHGSAWQSPDCQKLRADAPAELAVFQPSDALGVDPSDLDSPHDAILVLELGKGADPDNTTRTRLEQVLSPISNRLQRLG